MKRFSIRCALVLLAAGAVTKPVLADSVSGDVASGFQLEDADLNNSTCSFFTYSQQTGVGTNAKTFYFNNLAGGNTEDNIPQATTPTGGNVAIIVRHGLFGLGTKSTYSPAIGKGGVAKLTTLTQRQLLNSTSGDFVGKAGQNAGNGFVPNNIWASGDNSLSGKTNGSAAGASFDPFSFNSSSSISYAPDINASINLTKDTGGVMCYAVDSYMFSDINHFIEDGSNFGNTLWSLNIDSSGPIASKSGINIDFELNPHATELSIPGFTNVIDFDNAVDGEIASAITISGGVATLANFDPFPAGVLPVTQTMFTPHDGSSELFADGVEADITGVPLPPASAAGMALLVGLSAWRGRRVLA